MIKVSRNSIRAATLAVFAVLTAVLLLLFSKQAAEGISKGLNYSSQLLIPSLFPFMLLSSFIIRSGASDIIGRALSFFTTRFFRIPAEASAAVILSFIGGFPVGAGCVKALCDRNKLTSSQAEQLMMFCVCSGPAFLITGVGTFLLNNSAAGVILYVSQLVSGIILGFISGRMYRREKCNIPSEAGKKLPLPEQSLTDAFILSCKDASRSVIGLTAMVTAFTMLLSVASAIGISGGVSDILQWLRIDSCIADNIFLMIAEVTGACHDIAENGCPLWMISAAAGFGGLCVHFQIFSVLGEVKIRKTRFFLFRAGNAFLSSVIVYTVCRFRNETLEVFAPCEVRAELSSVSVVGAVVLVLMSAVFVLSLRADTKSRALQKRR